MCSRIFGPAMMPSLVMCPITMIDVPVCLANRLDRIDHDQVGAVLRDLGDDVFEVRLAVNVTRFVHDTDPFGPHLDLVRGLLARYVQRFQPGGFQRELQAQRRFADARFAAQQDDRALHQAAAQHAIHLAVGQVGARESLPFDLVHRPGAVAAARRCERGRARRFLADDLFDQRIPLAARRAFADPFGRLVPATAAEKRFF